MPTKNIPEPKSLQQPAGQVQRGEHLPNRERLSTWANYGVWWHVICGALAPSPFSLALDTEDAEGLDKPLGTARTRTCTSSGRTSSRSPQEAGWWQYGSGGK